MIRGFGDIGRSAARGWRHGGLAFGLALLCVLPVCVRAEPLGAASRARIAQGTPTRVIVEYDVTDIETRLGAERRQRGLDREDRALFTARRAAYRDRKTTVDAALAGHDASRLRELPQLPLGVWTVTSLSGLASLEHDPRLRAVHEDRVLRRASVSDLSFIRAPQAAALGGTGAGTTIAVVDGGLPTTYTTFSDFGSCNGTTLGGGCRVVVNQEFYPGLSAETAHGINVSAIALGTAPAAKLAMFNVFNGHGASSSDIVTALDTVLADRTGPNLYNYVVVNLSLGNGGSNASQCGASVFASAITLLANAGVTTVVAAGNSGSKSGLADPACVPGAISVGAVYDANHGGLTYTGICTDGATRADLVACFSQSAGYLSLLAPGSLVIAPSATYVDTGTSQATPHVAGAVAVLRARYPAEPLAETLLRLRSSGVSLVDPGNNQATPRLDLYGALTLGTALALTGTGPTVAVAGQSASYSLKVANAGPLDAQNVVVTLALPAGATVTSATTGCTVTAQSVICTLASLANGSTQTLTINIRWTVSGAVSALGSVVANQANSTPAQQSIVFGTAPGSAPAEADGPLPLWSYLLLAGLLLASSAGALRPGAR